MAGEGSEDLQWFFNGTVACTTEAEREEFAADRERFTGFRAFPDHHRYHADETAAMLAAARRGGWRGLVTTEKDALKVRRCLPGKSGAAVLALEVEMEITGGSEPLRRAVLEAAGRPPSPAAQR